MASANNLPNMPMQPIESAIMPGNGPKPKPATNINIMIVSGSALSVAIKKRLVLRIHIGAMFAAAAIPNKIEKTAPMIVPKNAITIVWSAGTNISLNALQSGGNIKEITSIPLGIPFIKSGILKPTKVEARKTTIAMAMMIKKGVLYLFKDRGFELFITDGCILYLLGDF